MGVYISVMSGGVISNLSVNFKLFVSLLEELGSPSMLLTRLSVMTLGSSSIPHFGLQIMLKVEFNQVIC